MDIDIKGDNVYQKASLKSSERAEMNYYQQRF